LKPDGATKVIENIEKGFDAGLETTTENGVARKPTRILGWDETEGGTCWTVVAPEVIIVDVVFPLGSVEVTVESALKGSSLGDWTMFA
jgi:hypothetical protein